MCIYFFSYDTSKLYIPDKGFCMRNRVCACVQMEIVSVFERNEQIVTKSTRRYFFRKCWFKIRMNQQIDEGHNTREKDFPASFLEIEVLLFHLIDCLVAAIVFSVSLRRHETLILFHLFCLASQISTDVLTPPPTRV